MIITGAGAELGLLSAYIVIMGQILWIIYLLAVLSSDSYVWEEIASSIISHVVLDIGHFGGLSCLFGHITRGPGHRALWWLVFGDGIRDIDILFLSLFYLSGCVEVSEPYAI